MEEILHAYQRVKTLQMKTSVGSGKMRHRAVFPTNPVPLKVTRAVRVICGEMSGSESETSGLDEDADNHLFYRKTTLDQPCHTKIFVLGYPKSNEGTDVIAVNDRDLAPIAD